MAGLIDINMNTDPNKVAGYDPERINLNPEDTVERKIQGIIAKNSPLMQLASTQGLQVANQRGVLNSSMAVGEAQKPVIGAAFPIAFQDSSTALQTKTLNQQAGNEAMRFGATGAQNIQGIMAQGAQARQNIGAEGEQQRLNIGAETAGRSQLSAQEYMQTRGLNEQTIGAQLDRDILTHQQALEQANQAGDIQTARDTQLQIYNLQNIQKELEGQKELSVQNYMQSRGLNEQTFQAQIERDILTHQQALEQARAAGDIQAERDARIQIYNLETVERQFNNEKALNEIRMAHEVTLKNLDLDQQKMLAEIEQGYRVALQNSASATNFYGITMQTIADIGANPDLNVAQRQAGINQSIDMLRAGLEMVGQISEEEFPIYTGTGTTNTPEGVTTTGVPSSTWVVDGSGQVRDGGGNIRQGKDLLDAGWTSRIDPNTEMTRWYPPGQ